MKVCPRCQHENPDDADFCAKCKNYLRWDPTRAVPAVPPPAAVSPPSPGHPPAGPPPTPPPAASPPPPPPPQAPAAPPVARSDEVQLTLGGPDGTASGRPTVSMPPGGQGELQGAVRNQSGKVDNYDLRLEGIPAELVHHHALHRLSRAVRRPGRGLRARSARAVPPAAERRGDGRGAPGHAGGAVTGKRRRRGGGGRRAHHHAVSPARVRASARARQRPAQGELRRRDPKQRQRPHRDRLRRRGRGAALQVHVRRPQGHGQSRPSRRHRVHGGAAQPDLGGPARGAAVHGGSDLRRRRSGRAGARASSSRSRGCRGGRPSCWRS